MNEGDKQPLNAPCRGEMSDTADVVLEWREADGDQDSWRVLRWPDGSLELQRWARRQFAPDGWGRIGAPAGLLRKLVEWGNLLREKGLLEEPGQE